MNYLFDVSPTDVPDQTKKHRKSRPKQHAEAAPAPEVRYIEHAILGQSDEHYACYNPSCQATYFDIIDDYRGEWVIECAFCGWQQRVPAIDGVIERDDGFVFFEGRFSGTPLAEVAKTEAGMTYIRWCAENHRSGSVKMACQDWLHSVGYSSTQR